MSWFIRRGSDERPKLVIVCNDCHSRITVGGAQLKALVKIDAPRPKNPGVVEKNETAGTLGNNVIPFKPKDPRGENVIPFRPKEPKK